MKVLRDDMTTPIYMGITGTGSLIGSLFGRGLSPLEWAGLAAIILVLASGLRALYKKMKSRGSAKKAPFHPVIDHSLHDQDARRRGGGDELILLVDDDPLVLKMNSAAIRRLGYEVATVDSGEEAIRWLQNQDADLVVMDIVMPRMNGIETLRRIKQFKPRQKAIALSGYARPSLVNEMLLLGVGAYLIKPAPMDSLARAIRKELDAEEPKVS